MDPKAPLRNRTDRLIVAGIALLLTLALAVLLISWRHINDRRGQQLDERLRQELGAVITHCDGWSAGWASSVRVEEEHLRAHDTLPPAALADRWRTLIEAYWPIIAIQVADERGNETALIRQDSMLLLRETHEGSENGPPMLTRVDTLPGDTVSPRTWLAATDYDPRREAWFGQALHNRTVDPVWSVNDAGNGTLCISQLVRPSRTGQPYRILQFTIDPARSGSAMLPYHGGIEQWTLLVLPTGALISQLPDGHAGTDAVIDKALARWRERQTEDAFNMNTPAGTLRCRMHTHPLRGIQVQIGVIMSPRPYEEIVWQARLLVMAGAGVILLLASLLVAAYLRKHRDLLQLQQERLKVEAQQASLVKAIGERDVLDRETHHRVKNNLQVVSSLLNLQAQRLDDGAVKEEFLRGKQRIDTMALVHHKLYGLPDLRGIDLKSFFDDLVRSIKATHEPRSHTVSCTVDAGGIKADTDSAIELGIILCELVGNCYQHAFPYATGGHIDVSVRRMERDLHRLVVKDNGTGMGNIGTGARPKLGLEIVEALAGQLDGSFSVRSEGGVTFEVLFRMDEVPADGATVAGGKAGR